MDDKELAKFINKNPHYKDLSPEFHFYDHNDRTGTAGAKPADIKVYTKQYVYPDNLKVKYKSQIVRVLYILFPFMNSAKPFDNLAHLMFIIDFGSNGIIVVPQKECELQ